MKIYLTGIFPTPSSSQYEKLLELWNISSKKHDLCSAPAEAELIIITDIKGPNWFEDLRKCSVIRDPSICFVISDADYPMPLLHGIYASNKKQLRISSRFRTGCYALYPEKLKNTFIKCSHGKAYLKPKAFLYSFIGQDSSPLRLDLFKRKSIREDILALDSTQQFNLYSQDALDKKSQLQFYHDTLEKSKFILCPKGTSPASLRLFEAMKMGVAPVIISDDWVLPKGPTWKEFAIFIPENRLDQLDTLLEEKENEYAFRGEKAQQAYEQFFAEEVYFDYLVDQMLEIKKHQKIPEIIFWKLRNFIVHMWKLQRRLK